MNDERDERGTALRAPETAYEHLTHWVEGAFVVVCMLGMLCLILVVESLKWVRGKLDRE